ncbi:hypothetical protein CC2G_006449 [Coprinopsis cinerea AmutBmut pab1-1]|nr:hypothetical protein CC2G_006449 [Coprinopsis cinerea AmutBmut pab1-1]
MAKKRKQSQPRPTTIGGYTKAIKDLEASLDAEQETLAHMLLDYSASDPGVRGWKMSRIKGAKGRVSASKAHLGQLKKELEALRAKGEKAGEQGGGPASESGAPSPLTSIEDDGLDAALLEPDDNVDDPEHDEQVLHGNDVFNLAEDDNEMRTTVKTFAQLLAPSLLETAPATRDKPTEPKRPLSPVKVIGCWHYI